MYTNELLEEKFKAQRQLLQKAKKNKKSYFEIVNEEAKALFKRNGWKMKFSERTGGYI